MRPGSLILRGDARALPLPDASVDLIVTSPPYWGLREYTDGGAPLAGQIGAEATPAAYIDALLECTAEWMRVLKPSGSLFVNLGDAYANTATPKRVGSSDGATCRAARPGRRTSAGTGIRPKSLYALPERYLIGCIDKLGLIARRDIIWHKTSALPESVADRAATRHEYVYHLVKQERYFAAVDYIREPPTGYWRAPGANRATPGGQRPRAMADSCNPLGRLPGSVWDIAGEPLSAPQHLGVEHYAAFPTELPRRLILGWSPTGWCAACGEPRQPTIVRGPTRGDFNGAAGRDARAGRTANSLDRNRIYRERVKAGIGPRLLGEVCACAEPIAPALPSVVLDPFGGTGTTALVASALGRVGVTVDRSADYCCLAQWRTADPGQRAKVLGLPKPHVETDGQLDLFNEIGDGAA